MLVDIEHKAALEVMAVRTLLRAAEDGSMSAMARVLDTNSGAKVMGFYKPKEAAPDLPDPGEFADGGAD